MNARTLKRAIGVSNGKSLTISNDCATVEITRDIDEDTGRVEYRCTGDLADDHNPGVAVFADPEKALAYALKSLALYMDGSPNR